MERMEMLLFFTTKHLKRRILSKYDIPMSYISSIELTQVFFLKLSLFKHASLLVGKSEFVKHISV